MITANAIQRTFHIRQGDSTGTAFAIDRDNKQYLITARHVVEDFTSGRCIDLFHQRRWKNVSADVVGIGSDEIDLAVLACSVRLAPTHRLVASSRGLIYGQTVHFLGFPLGLDSGMDSINRDLPVPFVKAGIVSAIITGDASRFYIDAHGNKGFSGGPVVFVPSGRPETELKVAAVVANAPELLKAAIGKSGSPLVDDDGDPFAFFPENQGFVVAFDIRHATELIDSNPVGFQLPSD